MRLFVRRAIATLAAVAVLAGLGSLTLPLAMGAADEPLATASVQEFDFNPEWVAATESTSPAREEYSVTILDLVQWPLAASTPISSYFGYRSCSGCSTMHSGIDFTPGAGVPIEAIADGVVVESNNDGSWGEHIIIEHRIKGVTIRSAYAHMEWGSSPFSVGDTVKRGQVVGTVGNTGQSFGAHLHFVIQTADGTFIDPLPWMRSHVNTDD